MVDAIDLASLESLRVTSWSWNVNAGCRANRFQVLHAASREVVEADDLMSRLEQSLAEVRADHPAPPATTILTWLPSMRVRTVGGLLRKRPVHRPRARGASRGVADPSAVQLEVSWGQ
jgi:hypothetical protein